MIRGAHCLLCHLALIHVSGRLVVLRERLSCCDHAEHIYWIDLLVSRVPSDVLLHACN